MSLSYEFSRVGPDKQTILKQLNHFDKAFHSFPLELRLGIEKNLRPMRIQDMIKPIFSNLTTFTQVLKYKILEPSINFWDMFSMSLVYTAEKELGQKRHEYKALGQFLENSKSLSPLSRHMIKDKDVSEDLFSDRPEKKDCFIENLTDQNFEELSSALNSLSFSDESLIIKNCACSPKNFKKLLRNLPKSVRTIKIIDSPTIEKEKDLLCELIQQFQIRPQIKSLKIEGPSIDLALNVKHSKKGESFSELEVSKLPGNQINHVLQSALTSFPNLNSLTLDQLSLTQNEWSELIDKLPVSLNEFTISQMTLDSTSAQKLGNKLGQLPLEVFSIELNKHHFNSDYDTIDQKGLRKLLKTFIRTNPPQLKRLEISNYLKTDNREWFLVAYALYQALKHRHILPTNVMGYDGEMNNQHINTWLNAAMIVHTINMLDTLKQDQLDAIPEKSWSSYSSLTEALNHRLVENEEEKYKEFSKPVVEKVEENI